MVVIGMQVRKIECTVCKVDTKLGLVFGFALICKVDGEPYYDTGSLDEETGEVIRDHVSEEEMLAATTDFMKSARIANEMHTPGDESGMVVHSFPLTTDIAKALDIETATTGWLVAVAPDAEMLAKFASREFTGFSIEGTAERTKEIA